MTALVLVLVLAAVVVAPAGRRPPLVVTTRSATAASDDDAQTTSATVAEVARLLVAGLHSGAGVVEALEVVAELGPAAARADLRVVVAAYRWGLPPERAWASAARVWRPVADAVVAADEAGLSPVRALEAAATRIDTERRARVEAATRRVEVLVVLPLGLAFLPGFVLTTVVPVVVGLAAGLLDGAAP